VKKRGLRTPKNYDGTQVTTHKVGDLLSAALSRLHTTQQYRPDILLQAWPEIIGPQLAVMTQAVSFCDGILVVKVKNSTLHSLLSRHEKFRILALIQKKFPKSAIQNILFRIA
jgi:hypothetical protein